MSVGRQELMYEESLSFVALAEGERLTAKGEMKKVMLFLICDHDGDGDGGVKANDDLLPPEQALAQWIAGFMVRNEVNPGSYSLEYRLID